MKLLYEKMYDDRYGSSGYFSIYKCPSCGFGRTSPALGKNEIEKLYSRYYPIRKISAGEVRKRVELPLKLKSWINGTNNIAHYYVRKNSDVLDVGSGSGVSLLEINKLGANAYGVEPDPNSQRLAKDLGLKVSKGFLSDNPFKGRLFDFVTASQVIEHEPEPLKFLKLAKKRLKPGGKVILSCPNIKSFYCNLFGRSWLNWHMPYHINHFSKESIMILAKKASLKVTKIKSITPNLWTDIQFKTIEVISNYGKPSAVWAGKEHMLPLLRFLNKALSVVMLPVNRLIDLFGTGDSLLVFLEKK